MNAWPENSRIPYVNGVPDLREVSESLRGVVPPQFNSHLDADGLAAIHKAIYNAYPNDFTSPTDVKNALSNAGLTPHHFLDANVQLARTDLHTALSHSSGVAAENYDVVP